MKDFLYKAAAASVFGGVVYSLSQQEEPKKEKIGQGLSHRQQARPTVQIQERIDMVKPVQMDIEQAQVSKQAFVASLEPKQVPVIQAPVAQEVPVIQEAVAPAFIAQEPAMSVSHEKVGSMGDIVSAQSSSTFSDHQSSFPADVQQHHGNHDEAVKSVVPAIGGAEAEVANNYTQKIVIGLGIGLAMVFGGYKGAEFFSKRNK